MRLPSPSPILPVIVACLAMTGLPFARSANGTHAAESVPSRLRATLRVNWQAMPLPRAIQRIEATQQLTIWVDRRIPLDRLVDLSTPETTVEDVLRTLAQQQDAEICLVGSTIYFGPAATATQLPQQYQRLRTQIGRLPPDRRRAWLHRRTIAWSTPTEPRALLSTWNEQFGLALQDLSQVPHDLWSARTDGPISLAEITTLTLAGFHQGISIGADGQARIVPLPDGTATSDTATRAGSPTEHAPAGSARPPRRDKRVLSGRQRFTLTVQNQPLGDVLDAIRAQADLQVTWPANSEALRQQSVSAAVEDVPLHELLDALFASLPARYVLQGQTLEIHPQP